MIREDKKTLDMRDGGIDIAGNTQYDTCCKSKHTLTHYTYSYKQVDSDVKLHEVIYQRQVVFTFAHMFILFEEKGP